MTARLENAFALLETVNESLTDLGTIPPDTLGMLRNAMGLIDQEMKAPPVQALAPVAPRPVGPRARPVAFTSEEEVDQLAELLFAAQQAAPTPQTAQVAYERAETFMKEKDKRIIARERERGPRR